MYRGRSTGVVIPACNVKRSIRAVKMDGDGQMDPGYLPALLDAVTIEAPCSKLQRIFEVQGSEEARFPCCSLTRQQAAGTAMYAARSNVLAMHFQATPK